MGMLSTKVEFEKGSVDQAAEWCGQVSRALHDVGTDIRKVGTDSEASYEGAAGDALRSDIGDQASTVDEFVSRVDKVKQAISEFTGDMHTVELRINQARSVAEGGGCELTPDGIVDPGPAPQPTGLAAATGPIPPEQAGSHTDAINAHNAAVGDHQKKVKAFQEAKTTVDEARQKEIDAHNALGHKLQQFQLREFNEAKKNTVWGVGVGISASRTFKTASGELLKLSRSLSRDAARESQAFLGWWDSIGTRADAMATKAAGYTANGMKLLPGKAFDVINADPLNQGRKISTTLARADAWGKLPPSIAQDSLGTSAKKFGARAVKGVPLLGTAVSIGSSAVDYADGSKGAGAATGEAAGSIAGGAAGAAALSFIPVVGTTVGGFAGGLVGGEVGSWVGGMFD